ncbi:hypothetical protein Ndes2526B_g08555 [Nannochloris sp. 'desiccata']|nr:hypothetical protein KSW81_001849 [Chlorella desiccata (nom. nud.)]KAH7616462.1 putative Ankyrin repeat-containing protein P16F5.05c [Chlorella desiccata (nom. nud.)]
MAPQYSEIVDLLIDGARYNDAEDVQSALDQGADINSQDEQGRSAAHMAAANGHVDLLQNLIDRGATVNLANIEGNTPLHWACVNNQNAAVRVLMQAGANASALNTHENTPVDEALLREYQKLVDTINEFSSKSGAGGNTNCTTEGGAEIDDVPDDAEEVAGEEGDDEDELMGGDREERRID